MQMLIKLFEVSLNTDDQFYAECLVGNMSKEGSGLTTCIPFKEVSCMGVVEDSIIVFTRKGPIFQITQDDIPGMSNHDALQLSARFNENEFELINGSLYYKGE